MNRIDAFTVKYNALSNVINSQVGVCAPFSQNDPAPEINKHVAIWDTGASCTVITQKVVDGLNLKPIDIVMASSASATEPTEVYLINLLLPNNIMIPGLRVLKMNVANSDVLVGMDIINLGDLSVTNHEGKTCMSFRLPSMHEVDYVKRIEENLKKKSNPKTKKRRKKNRRK